MQDREQQKLLKPAQISEITWLEDLVGELQENAELNNFDKAVGCELHAFLPTEFSVPVLYHEWPGKAYLSIDANERQRRVQKLEPPAVSDEDYARFLTTVRPG